MKPEALDALAGDTMRPNALEAVAAPASDASTAQVDGTSSGKDTHLNSPSDTPKQPSTPFGQRIDGTKSAAKVVEEVVHGVKVAVDGAMAWAEKKAEEPSSEADNNGPYTSPATCAPSDLDPIASGALPIMSTSKKATEEDTAKEQNNAEEGTKEETSDGKVEEKESSTRSS